MKQFWPFAPSLPAVFLLVNASFLCVRRHLQRETGFRQLVPCNVKQRLTEFALFRVRNQWYTFMYETMCNMIFVGRLSCFKAIAKSPNWRIPLIGCPRFVFSSYCQLPSTSGGRFLLDASELISHAPFCKFSFSKF